MKPLNLKKTIKSLMAQKLPIFIWGSPGIGKSSIVKQVAKEKDLEFLDLRLSLLDPTDLKGIPFFNKDSNEAVWAQPDFLPKDKNSAGVLFLDEINTAPPSVQAAAYQLILDRKIADYELPPKWVIVAAGNKESDRGVVYKMPPPLSNRFVHLELEVDFNDWKEWAYKEGIEPIVISFLNFDSSNLFKFDPLSSSKSFATPRSWEYVDKILKSNLPKELELDAIAGAVGKDIALLFISFKNIYNKLPNIKDILNGKEVEFESEPKILFALIGAIVSKAKSASKEQLENIIKFSYRLPKEFAIALIKDMQKSGIEIEDLDSFEEWVEKFASLLE